MGALATFVVFWTLVAHVVASRERRTELARKKKHDWILELAGLAVQGAVVPMVLVVMVANGLEHLAPSFRGAAQVPPVAAFLLNFILVDYIYYWNHRLLHQKALWPVHAVHHAAPFMDVFSTSRNTLWASGLIVYVWANGLALYSLQDTTFYMAGATATACLDLWRHSATRVRPYPRVARLLGSLLVLPDDHAWHHGKDAEPGNYGANLNVWDKMHGTWLGPREERPVVGAPCPLSLARAMFWPFSNRRSQPREA